MDLICFFVLWLLCLFVRLFICVLWSLAGKGLIYWLSFVASSSVNNFLDMLPTIRLSPLGSPIIRK